MAVENAIDRFNKSLVDYSQQQANGIKRGKLLAALLLAAACGGASFGLRSVAPPVIMGRAIDFTPLLRLGTALSLSTSVYLVAEPTLRQRKASQKLDRAIDGVVERHHRFVGERYSKNTDSTHVKHAIIGSIETLSEDMNVDSIRKEIYRRFERHDIDLRSMKETEAERETLGGRIRKLDDGIADLVAMELGGCSLSSDKDRRAVLVEKFGQEKVDSWAKEAVERLELPEDDDERTPLHEIQLESALIDRAIAELYPDFSSGARREGVLRGRFLLRDLADAEGIDAVEKAFSDIEEVAERQASGLEVNNEAHLALHLLGVNTANGDVVASLEEVFGEERVYSFAKEVASEGWTNPIGRRTVRQFRDTIKGSDDKELFDNQLREQAILSQVSGIDFKEEGTWLPALIRRFGLARVNAALEGA